MTPGGVTWSEVASWQDLRAEVGYLSEQRMILTALAERLEAEARRWPVVSMRESIVAAAERVREEGLSALIATERAHAAAADREADHERALTTALAARGRAYTVIAQVRENLATLERAGDLYNDHRIPPHPARIHP